MGRHKCPNLSQEGNSYLNAYVANAGPAGQSQMDLWAEEGRSNAAPFVNFNPRSGIDGAERFE